MRCCHWCVKPATLVLASVSGVLLGACDRVDRNDGGSMGMPASFSPARKVVRGNDQVARCNTVHSMTLPATMVERLRLNVAPETAVISCSLQAIEDGELINVPAQVSGTISAVGGAITQLDFKEVIEEETVSYVARFATEARPGARFDVTLVDPRTGTRHEVDFEQTRL